ncbi:MAG TPA: hypothetical protein VHZ24_12780 [Pirellulales bacterium]|jgi:hypothetical protein|nr:hypothetical protein [Pirellulales bacterium]
MAVIFPITLVLLMVVVVAFRQAYGFWSNLIMLGNTIVAALVATNYFELLAGLLAGIASFLQYYADFIAIWVIFAVTVFVLKAVTDIVSRYSVRFPKPLELAGNYLSVLALGWVLVCFAAMTVHLSPLGRNAFAGGFKPESANFWGFAPDRLWLGFAQRTSQGALGGNVFDPKGDLMLRYAARREQSDRPPPKTP